MHWTPNFSISYWELIKFPYFVETTERGDKGWKQAQRQGDFTDNFIKQETSWERLEPKALAELGTTLEWRKGRESIHVWISKGVLPENLKDTGFLHLSSHPAPNNPWHSSSLITSTNFTCYHSNYIIIIFVKFLEKYLLLVPNVEGLNCRLKILRN